MHTHIRAQRANKHVCEANILPHFCLGVLGRIMGIIKINFEYKVHKLSNRGTVRRRQ